MNKSNQSCFDGIKRAASEYRNEITKIYLNYRNTEAEVREESSAYKDEAGMYQAKMAAVKANARNAMKAENDTFSIRVGAEVKLLKKELDEHLLNCPTPALLETVRLFRDFGLTPSKADIAAMLTLAGGNTLALRCINSMLESCASPYIVDFPDSEIFEADLVEMEKLIHEQLAYSPAEFHHEAVDLYRGQPVQFYREDGTAYQNGMTYDSTRILTERAAFDSRVAALDEMEQRWTSSIIPSIGQVSNYEDKEDSETGEKVTAAEQYQQDKKATAQAAQIVDGVASGIVQAAQSGKAKSEAHVKAAEAIDRFAVK